MHYKRKSKSRCKEKMLSCGCCWRDNPHRLPIEDGPCNGKAKRKKPRKPKERCSVNRAHEWYKEPVVGPEICYYTRAVRTTYTLYTCIHCWVEKRVNQKTQYRRL